MNKFAPAAAERKATQQFITGTRSSAAAAAAAGSEQL